MAPPEKKQKTSEEKEDVAEKEEPKELEEDMKKDTSPKIKGEVKFLTADTTMNVLPSTVGNMLVPMTEGGLSALVAAARANIGVKSGRYMFEAKIVEETPSEWKSAKSMVRVGFSTAGSLFLGEEDNSVCFDSEGSFIHKRIKKKCPVHFGKETMVAVLLNIDEKSPNANTISLFKNGVRACEPMPLPDSLKGQTLYPAISFKGATVHFNFGAPLKPLPFKCKVLAEASAKEAELSKVDEPSDGKYTVLFPVSLPDEGSFDWLTAFLEKNPSYTELSNRAFADWADKSGLRSRNKKDNNDSFDTGINDVAGIKKTLMQIATLQPRNFIVMEVKGNLSKEDREAALAKFKTPVFKTVAEVIVGDPPAAFKKRVQAKTLEAKQERSNREFKVKKIQEKREWEARKKKKELEKQKAKLEKERKKKLEEIVKKRDEELKKKNEELEKKKKEAEAAEKKEGEEEGEKEEEKAEEKAEEEKAEEKEEEEKVEEKVEEKAEEEEEEPDEPDEPEPADEDPPKVSLDDEEKAIKFFKHTIPDLAPALFNTNFAKFSLPGDDEGFDQVQYSWAKKPDSAKYVKEWILERKLTTRVEDIVPSVWFKQKQQQWGANVNSWKGKQQEYKQMLAKKVAEKNKKAAEKAAKAAKKAAAEKAAQIAAEKKAKAAEEKAAKKAKEKEEKAKKIEELKEKGEEVPEELLKEDEEEEKPEEKEEEKAPEPEEEEEEEPEKEEPELDFEGVDVFGAEDILDVGNKVPLFKEWLPEDYIMLGLRFELHLLAHAFTKDCNDEERTGIYLEHLPFYYQKYYGKALSPGYFGVKTVAELVKLVKDTVTVNKQSVVLSLIPADLESNAVFAKITEESRRNRLLLVDMGEESAKLNIQSGGDKGNKGGWGRHDGNKGWGKDGGKDRSKGEKDGGKDGGKDRSKGWGKEGGKDAGKDWKDANKGGGKAKEGGKDSWKGGGKDDVNAVPLGVKGKGKDGKESKGGKDGQDGGKGKSKGWGGGGWGKSKW